MQERLKTDVLVIGTGIAGSTAALVAARQGLSVIAVTKEADAEETSTRYAQGGIVGGGLPEEDSPDLLFKDIVEAADGLAWPEAVKILSREGPALVDSLLIRDLGVPFDRLPDGDVDRTAEAAHSCRRIFHCKDATGREIEHHLLRTLSETSNITLLKSHTAIDLITESHHSSDALAIYRSNPCMGAYVFDGLSRQVKLIFAARVVLATGGLGQIFLHTTNPACATGDGIAMATRAGANVINAEYVQFHPTALFHRDADRFLISEAVRGEGGRLLNHQGERFMERYAPDQLELAPRDVVARAIHEEMERTNRSCVFLDIAHYAKDGIDVAARFPTIHEKCLRFGIDITDEPIPVVPAAHYFCGGPLVDEHGRSEIENLYCVGECSCTGLHGANRLASTSLLEGLVWGNRVAAHVIQDIREGEPIAQPRLDAIPDWKDEGLLDESDPTLVRQDWNTLKSTMWNYAGIVRTERRLKRADADLGYLFRRVENFYRSTRLSREIIELRNAILAGRLVVHSALRNKKSHGCHYRRS